MIEMADLNKDERTNDREGHKKLAHQPLVVDETQCCQKVLKKLERLHR